MSAHGYRNVRAALAAMLAAVVPAVPGAVVASPATHAQQELRQAKPESSAVTSVRQTRRMGPFGLPVYGYAGGQAPWVNRHGALLRCVTRPCHRNRA